MPDTVSRTGASQGVRPRWWTELPLIALVYAVYSAGRLLARGDVSTAVDHGVQILRWEQDLHIDFETPLNKIFTHHAWIGVPADFVYASLHYVVTPLVLVWLWRSRSDDYRVLRTWLLVSTLIGLIGFTLLPTCPPRLLGHGFVDTMAQYSDYGWWGGEASAPRGMGGMTNQYAAMPSLHCGWALWCGVALWRHGRSVWAKVAAVVYPLSIILVVMGTANHYFLDAVAGIAVMGVGYLLARPALRLTQPIFARFRRPSDTVPAQAAPAVRIPAPAAPGDDTAAGADGAPGRLENGESRSVVSAGCETSARERERIPRQSSGGARGGSAADRPERADGGAEADDGTPAAAR
ncbi:phosphatase PAP2 family protein [Streptomyces palmae]|uniref:PAP2 family protein n=1 Tax=Streptomyces palmae TaxID=1701085 RepID=A0A4Z0GSP1_9ACTN|nr:phosphatase PAP2 family protein [Streptomyces palmae]TGA99658.1 PAP2 family protein [Streptomyces palmae]